MKTGLIILGLIALVLVSVGFVGYVITTNKIILEQEREIAKLRTELKRGSKNSLKIIPDKERPKFGGF